MRERGRFSAAFNVVGELLSGVYTLAQLSRRHDVTSGLILYWKKRYEEADLVEGPSQSEKRSLARIAELERMVRRLTMENELQKGRRVHAAEKRAFITNHRQDFGIERGCEVMGLSRSTYCIAIRKHKPTCLS